MTVAGTPGPASPPGGAGDPAGSPDPAAPIDPTLIPPGLRAMDLEALAEEYGTPLVVYDEGELRARCARFVAAFGPDRVAYAAKAFLCGAMTRLVHEEGLHLDVATGGELFAALHAGFPPERVIVHGNNKSELELLDARDAGVGRIVVDAFDELDRIELLGVRAPLLVRVTPGVEAHTHAHIETGTEASKFGFSVRAGHALDAVRRVVEAGLPWRGLHCHIGSQVLRVDAYRRAAEVMAELAAEVEATLGVPVDELNLGGGFGVRYLTGDAELTPEEVAPVLAEAAGKRAVMVEPGRAVAGPAALTLYRVGVVKEVPGAGVFVAVDGGMSDNPRPVLYGARYEAYLPARAGEARPVRCRVVGKHCEQGDVLVADGRLPAGVRVGDLLAVPATGAYAYSMASNYNKVPRPAVVFVRDGFARLVVRRETPEDLVRLDTYD